MESVLTEHPVLPENTGMFIACWVGMDVLLWTHQVIREMQHLRVAWALAGAAVGFFLLFLIQAHFFGEGKQYSLSLAELTECWKKHTYKSANFTVNYYNKNKQLWLPELCRKNISGDDVANILMTFGYFALFLLNTSFNYIISIPTYLSY